MAKAIKAFYGSDTYGRSVERAQRVDGVWFARHMEFNGYANAMCKWEECEEPDFETHGVNAYSGEKFEYPEPVMMWGWNKMTEYSNKTGYRLPV